MELMQPDKASASTEGKVHWKLECLTGSSGSFTDNSWKTSVNDFCNTSWRQQLCIEG